MKRTPGIEAIDTFFNENAHKIESFCQAQKTTKTAEEKALEKVMHRFEEYLEKGAKGKPVDPLQIIVRGLEIATCDHLVEAFKSSGLDLRWWSDGMEDTFIIRPV